MMREEFTELTGMYVSGQMYKMIEEYYMESGLDKRKFCKEYMKNKDGLAEKIQRHVDMEYHNNDMMQRASVAGLKQKAEDLEKLLEEEKEENEKLEKLLDKYEWQPYVNSNNVSEEEYKRFEEKTFLTEEEAIDIIANEFGFVHDRITIQNFIESTEKNIRTGEIRIGCSRSIERHPYYEATDFNYIRFDVVAKNGIWQYEMLDGELRKFWE